MLRKTAVRLALLALLIAAGVLAAGAAPAAQGTPVIPTIIAFSADLASVSLSDVEAGTAETTLSWHVVHVGSDQRLALEFYELNQWVSLIEAGDFILPVGSRTITVGHPLNFGPPTYRLTVLEGRQGRVVDQMYLTIPYSAEAESAPAITTFASEVQGIDSSALSAGNAQIDVSWAVENRPATANLIFEQVLTPDSVVSVEMPRGELWVASSGTGAVLPGMPEIEAGVRLRLSLVDVTDGTVYDSEELIIPLMGDTLGLPPIGAALEPAAEPEATAAVEAEPAAAATEEPAAVEPAGEAAATESAPAAMPTASAPVSPTAPVINLFTAEPAVVPMGGNVVLTWTVENAQRVQIQEMLPNNVPGLLYIELPPAGAVSVPVPDNAIGVSYILRVISASGEEATQQVDVMIGAS